MKKFLILVLLPILTTGCATTPRPAAVSLADVISMTKAGSWDDDIIRRIESARTVYRLGADDVVRLRNEGVSDRVINYMLETYTRAAVAEQQRRDYYYYGSYYGPYYRPHWWW
ncbi:MAG: hypothetical protein FJ395_05915 [Verrucomicrobia bacterium]|nr:hypothetical protein [Verrucomicrobiota bacterium]